MNVDEIIEQGKAVGLIIKRCHDSEYLAVDCGEATEPNEGMRLTSDGALLTVNEGRYWQVGEANVIAAFVMERMK